MKYWQRWIGDWKGSTSHLSAAEKGIFGELLDHCYATESPLPGDLDELNRLAGAQTDEERKAVRKVIERFFVKTDMGGYVNKKALAEIRQRREYESRQSTNSRSRWERDKKANGTTHARGSSKIEIKKCAYCDKPSQGAVSGREACAAHFENAMYGTTPSP